MNFTPIKTFLDRVSLSDIFSMDRWHKNGDHPKDCFTEKEGKIVRYYRHPSVPGESVCTLCNHTMHEHGWIDDVALEERGDVVCPGDVIISLGDNLFCALNYEDFKIIVGRLERDNMKQDVVSAYKLKYGDIN